MSASDHLHPKLFMTATELMTDTAGFDSQDWAVPFGKSKISPAYAGQSNVAEANNTDNLVDIKRAENSAPHDESPFGTDYETINEGETLTDSIKRQNIKNPVLLAFSNKHKKWVIGNGQHRAVAANDINPDMYVPVSYDFNWDIDDDKR